MTQTTALACPAPARKTGFVARFTTMLEIRRQRMHLAKLDAHIFRDIGLSDEQARSEASPPLWDAPANWRN